MAYLGAVTSSVAGRKMPGTSRTAVVCRAIASPESSDSHRTSPFIEKNFVAQSLEGAR